jgi:hypothetical protein
MVKEVTAFQTAGGKLCSTAEEAENEELLEMEKGFIKEAEDLLNYLLEPREIGLLRRIFRKQEKFKTLLEKYNIYD